MPGVEGDADVRTALRTELDRLGQRPDERHGRGRGRRRWRVRIDRGPPRRPRPPPPARVRNTSGPRNSSESRTSCLRRTSANRRQPAANDLPPFLLRRTARRRAQHQLKAAAADGRTKRRILRELRQLRRERRLIAVERALHRQVDDRRADLQLGEERARGFHACRARGPERPVDAAVADPRRDVRLLGPPDVASHGPRRQRDEHARLAARRRLERRHGERRGDRRRPLQEFPATQCFLHALSRGIQKPTLPCCPCHPWLRTRSELELLRRFCYRRPSAARTIANLRMQRNTPFGVRQLAEARFGSLACVSRRGGCYDAGEFARNGEAASTPTRSGPSFAVARVHRFGVPGDGRRRRLSARTSGANRTSVRR